jgi:hypothetical protein
MKIPMQFMKFLDMKCKESAEDHRAQFFEDKIYNS